MNSTEGARPLNVLLPRVVFDAICEKAHQLTMETGRLVSASEVARGACMASLGLRPLPAVRVRQRGRPALASATRLHGETE